MSHFTKLTKTTIQSHHLAFGNESLFDKQKRCNSIAILVYLQNVNTLIQMNMEWKRRTFYQRDLKFMLLFANLVQFFFGGYWRNNQLVMFPWHRRQIDGLNLLRFTWVAYWLTNSYVLKCCHQTFNKLRSYIATIPGFTPNALIVENSSHAIVLELIAIWVPVLPV